MDPSINTDTMKYRARAWRTGILKEQAQYEVAKMLQAFLPAGFVVEVHEDEHEVPGFPHAPHYKFRAKLCDGRRDDEGRPPSDIHVIASGYSREGAMAYLLAHLLDTTSFFPMT